ncbi:hypothetical protein GF325_01305 [Candidatus Bathyarchaeota archaeon]|nr:hypothetical protein [Candidatus Bathyarchaeota archaeon]
MIGTLTLNPMVGIHILALAQTVFTAIYLVVPANAKPVKKKRQRTLDFFRYFGLGTLSVFGILFMDIGLSWLAGNWTMTDWRFQLPNVILLVFLGMQYILIVLLHGGTILDVAFISVVSGIMIVFLHVIIPSEVVMGELLEDGLVFLLAIPAGIYAVISLVKVLLIDPRRLDQGESRGSWLSWDASEKLKKIYTRWLTVIFWVLTTFQSMLAFYGYSLLTLV